MNNKTWVIMVHINRGGNCQRCGAILKIRGLPEWGEGAWVALRRNATSFVAYALTNQTQMVQGMQLCVQMPSGLRQAHIIALKEKEETREHNQRAEDKIGEKR